MDSLNDAQIAYYGDTITPDKIRVLNVKASRVAGDVEAEPNGTERRPPPETDGLHFGWAGLRHHLTADGTQWPTSGRGRHG
jgi:hypothetical protein